eukprot:TRINITY_DN68031_c6_g3_i8.p2 TRINITY_DN68031_c6_g3~~TRINITY_DN68031_c6_g3_i8.p2  ORF type:complete len:189 (+),score=37.17 TRINITY_DN68031_c6_g3_i8:32-598(+)
MNYNFGTPPPLSITPLNVCIQGSRPILFSPTAMAAPGTPISGSQVQGLGGFSPPPVQAHPHSPHSGGLPARWHVQQSPHLMNLQQQPTFEQPSSTPPTPSTPTSNRQPPAATAQTTPQATNQAPQSTNLGQPGFPNPLQAPQTPPQQQQPAFAQQHPTLVPPLRQDAFLFPAPIFSPTLKPGGPGQFW